MAEFTLNQIILAVLLLAALVAAGFLTRWLMLKYSTRGINAAAVRGVLRHAAADKDLVILLFLVGIYLAMAVLPLQGETRELSNRILSVALVVSGAYLGIALIDGLIRWAGRRVEVSGRLNALSHRLLKLTRVVAVLAEALVAVLACLHIVGYDAEALVAWLSGPGWRIALVMGLSVAAVVAVGAFVPVIVVASLARSTGESAEEVKKRSDTLSRVLVTAGQIAVIAIALFMVLGELSIEIGPMLAGAGVLGIAVGFGAQSLVKDIVAGLFIILENQYRVGDVVNIADKGGVVEDISLRRTVLRDLDGVVHYVPNGEIRVASNLTKEWSRVNINIEVAYGENLERVTAVINRVGQELAADPQWGPLILKAPQVLRVDKLGSSGVELKVLGDTKPIKQWEVMGELRRRIKDTFDREGIEIPWPHTKVYFGSAPPPRGLDRAGT